MQELIPVLIISFTVLVVAVLKKLTIPGAVCGGLIAFLIYTGTGYAGLAMLGSFFLLGTLATAWKSSAKEKAGLAEKNRGRRTAAQVLANGGVATLFSLCHYLNPQEQSLLMMVAAALASATADTLSSELGVVYGSRFYNICTLRRDQKGLNGVVSIEGTLIGIAGAGFIAIIYCIGWGWSFHFFIIVIAGTFGNITDSLLGATAERKGIVGNNMVNFLNTLVAAAFAYILYLIILVYG